MSISFEPTEVPNEVCDMGSAPASGLVVAFYFVPYYVLFLIAVTVVFTGIAGFMGAGAVDPSPQLTIKAILHIFVEVPFGLLHQVSRFACLFCFFVFFIMVATKQELVQELFPFVLPEEWSFEDSSRARYWSFVALQMSILLTHLFDCGSRFAKPDPNDVAANMTIFNVTIWFIVVIIRVVSGDKSLYPFLFDLLWNTLTVWLIWCGVSAPGFITHRLWRMKCLVARGLEAEELEQRYGRRY